MIVQFNNLNRKVKFIFLSLGHFQSEEPKPCAFFIYNPLTNSIIFEPKWQYRLALSFPLSIGARESRAYNKTVARHHSLEPSRERRR